MNGHPLERILTFSRNTMPAASLPLELQQEIFSYLDSRSFYAARKVCRWWYLASFDSVTLARQLQKLPIKPTVISRETEPRELHRLFNEASQKLLLGVRLNEREDATDSLPCRSKTRVHAGPKVSAVSRGNKTVTINDGHFALFDTTREPPEVLLQRPLRNMIAVARQIPWLQIAPAASPALALSSDGGLLAVAQERTIQIFELSTSAKDETMCRTIASAAGHYIKGMDFEQNDRVLRVQLSGKGVVLYFGTPTPSNDAMEPATTDFWSSRAGLRHLFLDSSLLQLSAAAGAEQFQARLAGLQLLRPFADGFLFAAQKHGGNESSHYLYGHVKCSRPTEGLPIAAEPDSVMELARLESYLSAWDFVKDDGDDGMGRWDDMPSAHEHHPKFAISDDGGLLLLAEREKKHVRHVNWTQVFLYSVPSLLRVEELLRDGVIRTQVRWKRLAKFLSESREAGAEAGETTGLVKPKPVVARLPISIGTLEGEAKDVHFERHEAAGFGSYGIMVATEETRKSWQLIET